jgi:hypothetical protein
VLCISRLALAVAAAAVAAKLLLTWHDAALLSSLQAAQQADHPQKTYDAVNWLPRTCRDSSYRLLAT